MLQKDFFLTSVVLTVFQLLELTVQSHDLEISTTFFTTSALLLVTNGRRDVVVIEAALSKEVYTRMSPDDEALVPS